MTLQKKAPHRPGVNDDGSPGIRLQVIVSAQGAALIEEFRLLRGIATTGEAIRQLLVLGLASPPATRPESHGPRATERE